MRPSCGLRRSAMSSFASTFRRVVTPAARRFGIRCTSCSTPSMRRRTTSESSCGSQWMSEAPSSAAWKMTELTRRTSGASEMPSSASRSSASSSSAANASASSSSAARAPNASDWRTSRRTSASTSSRDATASSTVSRVASRSSSIAWTLPGSETATRSTSPSISYGIAVAALEHVQRHELRRLGVDVDHPEVDQRQLVAGGERARDAVGARGALVDERLRERTGGARAALREGELVRRQEAGRGEQVGEQLRLLVDLLELAGREPPGLLGRGLITCGWRRSSV